MAGKQKRDAVESLVRFAAHMQQSQSIAGASRAMGFSKTVGKGIVRRHPELRAYMAEKGELSRTHGRMGTPEHRSWSAMMNRCYSPTSSDYDYYGGRGIRVCERWHYFECFLADMGERASLRYSIDRIDVNGNYELSNCRWATSKQQASNRRNSRLIEFGGERLTVSEWARRLGMRQSKLFYRLFYSKLPVEQAFSP
jgi:hypothetical protein